MSKMKIYIFFSLFFIGLLLFPTSSRANEASDFTIIPIFGEGQTDDKLGYFSINYANKDNYPIKVKIKNLNPKQSSEFDVQIISATTSNNGKIDYAPSKKKKPNQKIPTIEEFVDKKDLQQNITLKPNEEKDITINLKKNVNNFEGTVLGSIYVKKKLDTTNAVRSNGIQNIFAMSIPIIISQNFEKKITPDLDLSNINVITEMGITKISGDISNKSPVMFGEITVDSWITKKDKNKKLYEAVNDKYEMAPNSYFTYSIDISNEILEPGIYTYHSVLKSGKKKFDLSKDFIINSQDSFQKSSELKKNEKKSSLYDIFLLIFIIILILIITNYLILSKKYHIFSYKNRKRRKKKKRR